MIHRLGVVAAVAVVLAAATASLLWGFLYVRPLPTVDGRYRLLGLDGPAEIVRDRLGVPHVFAEDAHDLYFLQGYATAQDRLAQLEAMREAAARLAGRRATDDVARTAPAVRAPLDAYAAGVTEITAQLRAARALPAELVLRGKDPAPWSSADVAAIADVYLDHVDPSSICAAAPASASASGRPVFAADVYVEAPDPGLYEIGLHGSEVSAVGISLPGVPGIVDGHNGWVAWSLVPSVRQGPAGSVDTVDGLLEATAATTATSFADALRGSEVAACVADVYGREGALDRDRAAFLPSTDRVLVFGGTQARSSRLADGLAHGRSIDPEAMRLLFGRGISGFPGGRAIVDLGASRLSRSAVSEGISGLRASRHFGDQAPIWEIGQVHLLPLARDAIGPAEGDLVFRPR